MIDVYASQEWYLHHLRPVYQALGEHAGDLIRKFTPQRSPVHRKNAVLVASWGDMGTVRKLGYTRIALMQHGAGQSYAGQSAVGVNNRGIAEHPSYPGGRGNEAASLFLSPNRHAADRWRRAYSGVRSEVIGCPKLDTLPARLPGPGPVVAISFHWNFAKSPELMSVFNEYHTALKPLAERFRVIGHGHPRRHDLPMAYRRLGIEYVPDFNDILRRADVYAFDNTSSGFEFAATGRPVVVMNGSGFRRDANHGLRFWDAAGVGVNVDRPRDLIAGVERALELRPVDVQARERALDIVYQPRSGGAKRAADVLIDWANSMLRPSFLDERVS